MKITTSVFALLFLWTTGCSESPADPTHAGTEVWSIDAQSASMTRVDVCHRTSAGDFTKITVAEAAYQTHLDHGDAAVGADVAGNPGYVFDSNCQPIVPTCPCWQSVDELGRIFDGVWYTEHSSDDGSWTNTLSDFWGNVGVVSFDGQQGSCSLEGYRNVNYSPISEAEARICADILRRAGQELL